MIRKLKFILIALLMVVFISPPSSFAGLSRVKTWVNGEVLLHTDLNGEFNNIIDNFLTGLSPLTGNLDFNSHEALNLVFEKLATDGTGVEGQVIYNTADDHLKLKNDSAWVYVLDAPTMGTSGQFLTTDGTDLSWATLTYHQSSKVSDASNRTTTSATYADMTGMSITLTTAAKPVLIGFSCAATNNTSATEVYFTVDIDGTEQSSGTSMAYFTPYAATAPVTIGFTYLSAALTAASHTFKIQWKVAGGTTAQVNGGSCLTNMWVVELK